MAIEEYFHSLKDIYPSLYEELNKEFTSKTITAFFKYDKHLKDPLQDITLDEKNDSSILNNLYDWYKLINPNYEALGNLNPFFHQFNGIQPYRTLLLNISKDLIILQTTKRFPKPKIPNMTNNNKLLFSNKTIFTNKNHIRIRNINTKKRKAEKLYNQNILSNQNNINSRALPNLEIDEKIHDMILNLLKLINQVLTREDPFYYKYVQIINIIDNYLQLFSFGKIDKYKNIHEKDILLDTLNTPFIIYPTFNMLSYTKVIYFMQAPVLNFYITNTRSWVHDSYFYPYKQILHDIEGHTMMTHAYGTMNKKTKHLTGFNNQFKEIKIDFDKFDSINKTINSLKKYFNYNSNFLKTNTIEENDNKFILCYILFHFTHEDVMPGTGISFFLLSISNMIKRIERDDMGNNKYSTLIEDFPPHKYPNIIKFKNILTNDNVIKQLTALDTLNKMTSTMSLSSLSTYFSKLFKK